jgi:hypothetical protein
MAMGIIILRSGRVGLCIPIAPAMLVKGRLAHVAVHAVDLLAVFGGVTELLLFRFNIKVSFQDGQACTFISTNR